GTSGRTVVGFCCADHTCPGPPPGAGMGVAPESTPSSRSLNLAARNATQEPGERAPPTTRRNAPMKQQHVRISNPTHEVALRGIDGAHRSSAGLLLRRSALAAALTALCAPAAHAIDVTTGDWKLSFDGNVNADYIYSNCEALNNASAIAGGLTCVAPGTGE